MFGHQDHASDDTQQSEPMADGALASHNGSLMSPPPDDIAPTAPAPSAPVIDDTAASDYIMTSAPNANEDSTPAVASSSHSTDDLLNIKQQALQQLSPLVGHLDQSPDEKFRTTMMMIQGSDDQSLIPVAYEAAKQITDEKARAQALLDVVNEINYFTQHQAAA